MVNIHGALLYLFVTFFLVFTVPASAKCINNKSSCDYVIESRNHIVYVVNSGNDTISICQRNKDDGSVLDNCIISTAHGLLSQPQEIILNNKRTRAYISNLGTVQGFTKGSVTMCPLYRDGTFIEDECVAMGGNGSFDQPIGITLGNCDNFLYVANGLDSTPSSISSCPIRPDGNFSYCARQYHCGPLGSNGVTVDPLCKFIYITNYYSNFDHSTPNRGPGAITICPLDECGTIELERCIQSDAGNTVNRPFGIKINPLFTFAIIVNKGENETSRSLSVCPVDQFSGLLSSDCTSIDDSSLSSPHSQSFDPLGRFAYITNTNNNTLTVCGFGKFGSISKCESYGGDGLFNQPRGIFVYE